MTAPIIIILAIAATLAWVVSRISTTQAHRSPATQICQALETIHTLPKTLTMGVPLPKGSPSAP